MFVKIHVYGHALFVNEVSYSMPELGTSLGVNICQSSAAFPIWNLVKTKTKQFENLPQSQRDVNFSCGTGVPKSYWFLHNQMILCNHQLGKMVKTKAEKLGCTYWKIGGSRRWVNEWEPWWLIYINNNEVTYNEHFLSQVLKHSHHPRGHLVSMESSCCPMELLSESRISFLYMRYKIVMFFRFKVTAKQRCSSNMP